MCCRLGDDSNGEISAGSDDVIRPLPSTPLRGINLRLEIEKMSVLESTGEEKKAKSVRRGRCANKSMSGMSGCFVDEEWVLKYRD